MSPALAGPVKRPLKTARMLSAVILVVGVFMLVLGGGVAIGRIPDGWGFPMSQIPNWGKPWGLALILAGACYVVFPIQLLRRPDRGSISMMIVSGISVLVGTPLITSATEIFYNLFQETKSRPDWVDAVWGYFMIVQIGNMVALYKAYPMPEDEANPVGAD